MSGMVRTDREGFSALELLLALLILTVALFSMASAMAYHLTEVRVAGVDTNRTWVLQETVERLHALPFDSVTSRTREEAVTVNGYRLWWGVRPVGHDLKQVAVFAEGRDYRPGSGWQAAAVDTMEFSMARRRGEP